MRVLKIEDVTPGMKLARSVFDGAGNLLLPEGMALTGEALERLRARKVTSLTVEGEGPSSAGVASPEDRNKAQEKIEAELAALFAGLPPHPVMDAVRAAALNVLRDKMARKP